MKVVILSRSGSIASTRRLVEAGRADGHQVRVLNPTKVEMHLEGKTAGLYYRRKRLTSCDVVIPRIAQSVSSYGLAVLDQFAMSGTVQLNSAQGIARARNKMRALQLLSAHGIGIPATVMARDAEDLREMVSLVGGMPVLIRLLHGQDRQGVMVCESLVSLQAVLEAMLGLGHNIIVQQYVKKSGFDVRIMVVGGEVMGAVRRRAQVGQLRHTLSRGARLDRIEPNEAQKTAAVETARLMGLEVAAIDLLEVRGVPKVFEVNASPAIPEMERATGVDIASAIIRRAELLVARQSQPGEAPLGISGQTGGRRAGGTS